MKKRLKGFFCDTCHGQRLHVVTVRRALPRLVVRYRECLACNNTVRTEEREAPSRGKPIDTPAHWLTRLVDAVSSGNRALEADVKKQLLRLGIDASIRTEPIDSV